MQGGRHLIFWSPSSFWSSHHANLMRHTVPLCRLVRKFYDVMYRAPKIVYSAHCLHHEPATHVTGRETSSSTARSVTHRCLSAHWSFILLHSSRVFDPQRLLTAASPVLNLSEILKVEMKTYCTVPDYPDCIGPWGRTNFIPSKSGLTCMAGRLTPSTFACQACKVTPSFSRSFCPR